MRNMIGTLATATALVAAWMIAAGFVWMTFASRRDQFRGTDHRRWLRFPRRLMGVTVRDVQEPADLDLEWELATAQTSARIMPIYVARQRERLEAAKAADERLAPRYYGRKIEDLELPSQDV